MVNEWKNFKKGSWNEGIDVRDFIQKNYKGYEGDKSFLSGTTEKTKKVWSIASSLILKEIKMGILDVDTDTISGINSFNPGYIDKENETIPACPGLFHLPS